MISFKEKRTSFKEKRIFVKEKRISFQRKEDFLSKECIFSMWSRFAITQCPPSQIPRSREKRLPPRCDRNISYPYAIQGVSILYNMQQLHCSPTCPRNIGRRSCQWHEANNVMIKVWSFKCTRARIWDYLILGSNSLTVTGKARLHRAGFIQIYFQKAAYGCSSDLNLTILT